MYYSLLRLFTLFTLLCGIQGTRIYSQETFKKYRQVGINTTTLLSQLVPFNRTARLTGPYDLHFYRISKKGRGMRYSFGANISDVTEEKINFLVALTRPKSIGSNGKFVLQRSTGMFLSVGGLSLPSERALTSSDDVVVGVSISRGLEYFIADNISISTEAFIHLGIGAFGGGLFTITPPYAINLNIKM